MTSLCSIRIPRKRTFIHNLIITIIIACLSSSVLPAILLFYYLLYRPSLTSLILYTLLSHLPDILLISAAPVNIPPASSQEGKLTRPARSNSLGLFSPVHLSHKLWKTSTTYPNCVFPHQTTMSSLKKALRKLKEFNPNAPSTDSSENQSRSGSPKRSNSKLKFAEGTRDASGASSPDPRRRSRDLIQEERQRRSMDKERLKVEQKKRHQLARLASDNFMKEGPEEITNLYRPFSMNMSKRWNHEHRQLFKELDFESQSQKTL